MQFVDSDTRQYSTGEIARPGGAATPENAADRSIATPVNPQ
jgi:hypothetical protein